VAAYFLFQIWIQHGQITTIHLFTSKGKTSSLNLFFSVIEKKRWYERVQKSVETSQDGKLIVLWNKQVQTDRTDPNNQPAIIIRGNEEGTFC
jgi:hypothetical protein